MNNDHDTARLELLISDLSAANAEDAAAIAHAQALRDETTGFLNTQGMDAFCKAGDRMRLAGRRKVDALSALDDEQQVFRATRL